jgi:translation initiation factor IF-3
VRSKRQPTRELRLRVGIADRDFEAKVMQARTLLAAGANIRLGVEIAAGQERRRARDLADSPMRREMQPRLSCRLKTATARW